MLAICLAATFSPSSIGNMEDVERHAWSHTHQGIAHTPEVLRIASSNSVVFQANSCLQYSCGVVFVDRALTTITEHY